MSVKFIDAPEVEQIASRLIGQYHTHLDPADIRFFFFAKYGKGGTLKPWVECGRVLGYARKYTGEQKATLDAPDFGIGILLNWWDGASAEQKEAIVDHELMHCRYKDMDSDNLDVEEDDDTPPQPYIYQHEFQGFTDELKRHGAWNRTYEIVAEQLKMSI